MFSLRVAARNVARPRAAFVFPQTLAVSQLRSRIPSFAAYSAAAGLSREQITSRVLEVLKGFEKVDANKLSTSSSFTKDLGLDSLDSVEVVMAIEEEFAIEIPDAEADEIQTVEQAIEYIAKTPEAH